MATILFDFDSTLCPDESLEVVLRASIGDDEERLGRVEAWTRRGMEGEVDFRTSLESRLAIARPTLGAVRRIGAELAGALTEGARECVDVLRDAGHDVRIVSGGFRDVILPSARALGLADDSVHAVSAAWGAGGDLDHLVDDGFLDSKVEGIRRLDPAWPRPIFGVGDGATDHALLDAGVTDHFVAFTGHVRRGFLDRVKVPEVDHMRELPPLIESLLP
jgi:phosphoserine phosphatase